MDQTSVTTSARTDRSEHLFSEKYVWQAGYYGDKHAKAHASEVKRTASVLRKTHKAFDLFLDPSELKAIAVAAQVLERLGEDLTAVASTARNIKKNKIENDRREREELADSCALRRWGNSDEAMLSEAKQLAEFNDEGSRSGANDWLCKRHKVEAALNYRRQFDIGPSLGELLRNFSIGNRQSTVEIRRCAAEYISHLHESTADPRRKMFNSWLVGLDDFEAWKKREVAA